MERTIFKISDICSIKSGKRLPAGCDFSTEPTKYRYIRARDIKSGRIRLDDIAYIDEKTKKLINKYIINSGDIAVTIVANIGDIGYASSECDGINLTENAVRLTQFDNKAVDSKYLAYYLGQSTMKTYMENMAAGAAQAKLGIYKIEKIKIQLPSLSAQKNIVKIIEQYDSLIESNNKRIKILEQMAENLYKEWFVRFRFPGHETAELENGLPKGWTRGKLRDIAFEAGKNIKPEKRDAFSHYLPIDSLPSHSMALQTEDVIENAESSLVSYKKGDILFGAMRPYFHKVIIAPFDGLTRTTCFVLNAKEADYRLFLYLLLFQATTIDYATTVCVGSTMPYDRWSDLSRMNIVIPDRNSAIALSNMVSVILDEAMLMYDKNRNLIRQRDLLLPRLMSGKLEV